MFANGPRFHWKLAKLAGLNISGRVYYVSVSVIAGYCYQGTTGINSIEKLLKTLIPVSAPEKDHVLKSILLPSGLHHGNNCHCL